MDLIGRRNCHRGYHPRAPLGGAPLLLCTPSNISHGTLSSVQTFRLLDERRTPRQLGCLPSFDQSHSLKSNPRQPSSRIVLHVPCVRSPFAPFGHPAVRAKVQEELEVPHHRRVALLEAEVEKHRHMFCKARREHERCKVRGVGPHETQTNPFSWPVVLILQLANRLSRAQRWMG